MGLDARIRYTKMVIRDAFIGLLKKKPLNRITVKEICDIADINRATFYKYYSDPFDLLEKIEQELLHQLQKKLNPSVNSFRDVFTLIMGSVQADFEEYQALFSDNGDSQFPVRIFALYYEHVSQATGRQFPMLSPAQRERLYYFMAQGCSGILTRWISGGMKESADEVSAFAERLIAGINAHL